MVDQERGNQHDAKSQPEQLIHDQTGRLILDVPHRSAQGLPVSEQGDQRQARQQNIRAALRGFGDNARPGPLEPRPCHHTVLYGEDAEQQHVDSECVQERRSCRRIHRFGNHQVSDKPDGVKKGGKEDAIAGDSIYENSNSLQHFSLLRGEEHCCPRDLERDYGRMGLRVLERNLNFPERKLEGRLWQGKARLDDRVREVHNEWSLWLHDWIGKKSFCTERSRISIRNNQQQLSDRSANSKLTPTRLRGHVPQQDLLNTVMDWNKTSRGVTACRKAST